MVTTLLSEIRDRLPMPIAQLAQGAAQLPSAQERHAASFYIWEASLKLLTTVALVEYAALGRPDASLQSTLRALSRPSLGHWWQILRELTRNLSSRERPEFQQLETFLFETRHKDLPQAAGLYVRLCELADHGARGSGTMVQVNALIDHLVQYRNDKIGHGAIGLGDEQVYEEMARYLAAGAASVLDQLDVLLGCRLIHVTSVSRQKSGAWLIDRHELTGLQPRPLEPLEMNPSHTELLPRSHCLYLHPAGMDLSDARGLLPDRLLYPLLDVTAMGDIAFLNAQSKSGRAKFLVYHRGEHQSEELISGLCDLLARLLGEPVGPTTVEEWAKEQLEAENAARPRTQRPSLQREPKFLGEFELLNVLGEGGMGRVYRAWQPSVARIVALKRMFGSGDRKAQARFQKEFRSLAHVHNPHVVAYFQHGNDGDDSYYVMELLQGADLARVCKQLVKNVDRMVGRKGSVGIDETSWDKAVSTAIGEAREFAESRRLSGDSRLDEPEAVRTETPEASILLPAAETACVRGGQAYIRRVITIGQQVADGLAALHSAGVVHRDIKPANIMITMDGRAVITDLGLAKLDNQSQGGAPSTKGFVGSAKYAAPEQHQSAREVDARADLYSLGVTLWELLTLRPFMGIVDDMPPDEVHRRLRLEPEPLRRYAPDVPPELEAVVMTCLERSETRRYASATKLEEDLSGWLAGKGVSVRPASLAVQLRRKLREYRRQAIAATSVAALLLLLVVLIVANEFRQSAKVARKAERRARSAERLSKKQATKATESAATAQAAKKNAARRAAELAVVRAEDHVQQGDWSGALLWYLDAARWEEESEQRAAREWDSHLNCLDMRGSPFWSTVIGVVRIDSDLPSGGQRGTSHWVRDRT